MRVPCHCAVYSLFAEISPAAQPAHFACEPVREQRRMLLVLLWPSHSKEERSGLVERLEAMGDWIGSKHTCVLSDAVELVRSVILQVSLVCLFCSCFSSLCVEDTFFMKCVLGINVFFFTKGKKKPTKIKVVLSNGMDTLTQHLYLTQ